MIKKNDNIGNSNLISNMQYIFILIMFVSISKDVKSIIFQIMGRIFNDIVVSFSSIMIQKNLIDRK